MNRILGRDKKKGFREGYQKVPSTKWEKNIEFLQKYDIEKIVQHMQKRNSDLASYVFPMFHFLTFFSAGFFFVFNYCTFLLEGIKKKREQKKVAKVRKQMLEKQQEEARQEKAKVLSSMIVCKFCKKCGGTGLKLRQDPATGKKFYTHQECLDSQNPTIEIKGDKLETAKTAGTA